MEKLYIIDSAPGICNQDDFNHDFKLLLTELSDHSPAMSMRAYGLVKLAVEKGYEIPW